MMNMKLFNTGIYYPADVEIGKYNQYSDLKKKLGVVKFEFKISDTHNEDDPKDNTLYKLVELYYEGV